MENTIENAAKYLEYKYGYTRERSEENDKWLHEMVAYASACSAPSSIGEDEIDQYIEDGKKRVRELLPMATSWEIQLYADGCKTGMLEMRSRLSDRKIVLPSEEEIKTDMVIKMVLKHLAIMDEKLINIQSKLNNL